MAEFVSFIFAEACYGRPME